MAHLDKNIPPFVILSKKSQKNVWKIIVLIIMKRQFFKYYTSIVNADESKDDKKKL